MKDQEVSPQVWTKWFLDAIHKIRQQKQRPSLERICHAVRQHHPVGENIVAEQLERLVTQGAILKVFNKGLSTYKDPGQGCHTRTVCVGRDTDLTKVVYKAIKELSEKQPDGCSPKGLENYIQQSMVLELGKGVDLSVLVKAALKRAVDRGSVLFDKKLYRVAAMSNDSDKTPRSGKKSLRTSDSESYSGRKRKSTFVESPKKEGLPICSECLGTAQKNKDNIAEDLKFCDNCGSGIHPSCLPDNHGETFKLLLSRGNQWRCDECYSCSSCNVTDLVAGLVCSGCDRCYHIGCLTPAVDRKGKGAWTCQSCIDGIAPPTPPPPRTSSDLSTPRPRHSNLRIAHLKSLRKAARANLVRRRGKVKEGGESSSEDVSSINSLMNSELPPGVTEKDLECFKMAREKASEMTKEQQTLPDGMASPKDKSLPPRCPAAIEFGQYLIKTWYSSPFPQEYARLGKLFLCEFCLKYAKSKFVLNRHLEKCSWRHPPGTEIYRHNEVSVFEVDGNVAKFYCQNLCLLAKLFLDHKTLYYDVEPFLFYVLTISDDYGFHIVGYFSKEKHCVQKYNVSCIMTLPHYQRKGYGRFLIDFSYLLSKAEGMAGTPEKPLSDLGRVSYHAYWRSVLLEYLDKHRSSDLTLNEISKQTGLHLEDICTSFEEMKMLREVDGSVALVVDWCLVDSHVAKVAVSTSRILINPECLRWTPLVTQIVNPYKPASSQDEDNDASGEDEDEDEEEQNSKNKSSSQFASANRTIKLENNVTPVGGRGKRGRKSFGRGAKKPKAKETPAIKVETSSNLRQRTLTEMVRKGKRGGRRGMPGRLSRRLEEAQSSQMEEEKDTTRHTREETATPVALPRKRGRLPQSDEAEETVKDSGLRKRRKSESATPVLQPGKLTPAPAATLSSGRRKQQPVHPAAESSDDGDVPPPVITRTGRVSSLKIKRLQDKKRKKETAKERVEMVNKRSIAAKLRWIERKKRKLLQDGGSELKSETSLDEDSRSHQKLAVAAPSRMAVSRLKKRRPGRPPKVKAVKLMRHSTLKRGRRVVKAEVEEDDTADDTTEQLDDSKADDEAVEEPGRSLSRRKILPSLRATKKNVTIGARNMKRRRGRVKGFVKKARVVDTAAKKINLKKSTAPSSTDTKVAAATVSKVPEEEVENMVPNESNVEKVTEEPMDINVGKESTTPVEESKAIEDKEESSIKEDKEDNDKKMEICAEVSNKNDNSDKEEDDDDEEHKKDPTDKANGEEEKDESDGESQNETTVKEISKTERRVLSDDSDDSRPPRSDHSRSPSPRHSSADEDDDETDDKRSMTPLSGIGDIPVTDKKGDESPIHNEPKNDTTVPPSEIPSETNNKEIVKENQSIDPPIVIDDESNEEKPKRPQTSSTEDNMTGPSQSSPIKSPARIDFIKKESRDVENPPERNERKLEERKSGGEMKTDMSTPIESAGQIRELLELPPREVKKEERKLDQRDLSMNYGSIKATVDLTQDDDSLPEPVKMPDHRERELCMQNVRKVEPKMYKEPMTSMPVMKTPSSMISEEQKIVATTAAAMAALAASVASSRSSCSGGGVSSSGGGGNNSVMDDSTGSRVLFPDPGSAGLSNSGATSRHAMVVPSHYSQCDVDVGSHMSSVESQQQQQAAAAAAAMTAAAMSAAAAAAAAQAQERNPQVSCYSDCAQQVSAAVHHQHHMASPHMMHYHQQQIKQNSSASRSKPSSSSSSSSQRARSPSQQLRHQVASPQPQPPPQYQQANYPAYIMHRVPTTVGTVQAGPPGGPNVAAAARIPSATACSNFYLQQAAVAAAGQQPGSLAKLQQLTNGLDTLSPHAMAASNSTPPPSHATPPPPPPSSYHKFYQAAAAASQPPPNQPPVRSRHPQAPPTHATPPLIPQYNPPFNGYRPQQSSSPYITNPNFINPSQMQMMNVQPQYSQDPQTPNSMYAYGYLNGSLMQPLNSTMRR